MSSPITKSLALIFLVGIIFAAKAQEAPSNKTIQVYVSKLDESSSKLNLFIKQNKALISNTDYSTTRYYCEFFYRPKPFIEC